MTHSHLSHPALRQAVGLQGCGDVPRVPPTFAARHCLQGCGDVPRVLPVDCTAPLRRLAQAQAQWLPMQLMKVRTPCTRAPLPCECHTCTCERVRTARLKCASAALRGAASACGALAVTARGALAVRRHRCAPTPVLDDNLLAAVFAALSTSVATSFDDALLAAVFAALHAVAIAVDAALLAAVVTPLDANLLAAVAAALLAAVATSFDPPVFLPVHAAHGSAAAPARASRPSLVPRVASARPHSSTVRTTRRNNGLIAGGQGVRRNAFSVEYKKRCPAC